MRTIKQASFIFFITVLFSHYLLAQETEWPLQHLDKKAGLSNSAINTIYMDQYDYMWFGTWDGLNRFDGDQIVTYKPVTDDKHSISNNVIRQILEDAEGNLWIVTHDGINRYDRKLDRFQRYFHQIKDIPFLENSLKATLSEDSTLYISLVGWGIAQYNSNTDQFDQIKVKNFPTNDVHLLGAFGERLYMVDSRGNLSGALFGESKISKIPNYVNSSFHRFVSLGDRYFLTYQNTPSTLTLCELKNGKIDNTTTFDTQSAQITTTANNHHNQTLLFGTAEGSIFSIKNQKDQLVWGSITNYVPTVHKRKLKIFSMLATKQDILWVGTDGDGIYKYITKERAFHPITEGDLEDGKLSRSIVRSIYIDDNKIYAGTRGGGLNVIRSGFPTQTYDKEKGIADNAVLSITKDKIGNTWIGTDGFGLNMLEVKTGKILNFPNDFINAPDDLLFGSVYKILIDTYGHLWLGTSGYGIIYLDIEKTSNGQYQLKEYYTITPESPTLPGDITIKSNIVYSIIEEEPNILWFGTRNGGLYRYNSLIRKFTHNLQADHKSRFALSNNDILSLYLDKNQLWVGTSGGLNKVNLSNYTVDQYTQNDGLANNTIHGILKDKFGKLWLSSNNGLFAFDPATNSFKNFNWSDGLLNYEYTDGAFFQQPGNNQLYFGGTKGIDVVSPDKIDTTTSFPRLVLTELMVSNVLIKPGDSTNILISNIDLQQQINLSYDENFLSFHFTTLDYWHKQRCEYRYFLEGFDTKWNNLGKQSSINLTNIPPGDYTLHLNNTNENGIWNPQERTIEIHIAPPFYRTTTAYVIYTLILMLMQAGMILILRNRVRQKKIREIERLKKEHADTIQKYKLEFFTDIAHEFRTPLTLILGPAATLLKKTQNNPLINGSVQSIYRNSLRLQKLIQELIQFRKVEMGKELLNIRSVNLTAFVEELLQSFRQYALDKEISLSFEAAETIHGQVDSNILEKIFINLVSNALKYTDHGGKVTIRMWREGDRSFFQVKDNGAGIPESDLARIFERFTSFHHDHESTNTNSVGIGLSLTQKLVHLHHGDINVSSKPHQGTEFTFWLPINLPSTQLLTADHPDQVMLNKLQDHVAAEFYHQDKLDKEMINISLERFDYNVLVVDDNVQIVSLLKELLSSKYNITACTSSTEALEIVSSRKIDLVISDVIMPEMNGYELCQAIKSKIEISHIPVILLTAKGEMDERIEGLQAGADAYIPKPFHPDHLYVRIEKLINSREALKKRFENLSPHEKEFTTIGIGAKDDEFFRKIDQFIKEEMANPQLDALHLANELGMSKTSLYKKVRDLTGQTPHALINQYRLKQAAFLLTNSEYNVSEIINLTGFNSRSYFYKSFQEMFHCPPSAYVGEAE